MEEDVCNKCTNEDGDWEVWRCECFDKALDTWETEED